MDSARSFKVKLTSNYKILMLSQLGHNGEKYQITILTCNVAWNTKILTCPFCAFLHFRFTQMKCSCDHCRPGFKLDYLAPIRFLTVDFLCAVLPHDSVQSQQQQQQQQHRPGAAQQNQPLHPRPAACYYRPGPGQTLSPVSTHQYANVCAHQRFGGLIRLFAVESQWRGSDYSIAMSLHSDHRYILYIHTYHVNNIMNHSKIQSVKPPMKF